MREIAVGCTLLPMLSKFLGHKFDCYGVSIFLEVDKVVRVLEYGDLGDYSDHLYDLCYPSGQPILSKDLYEAIKLEAGLPDKNATHVVIDIATDEIAVIKVTYGLPTRALDSLSGCTLVSTDEYF